MRCYQILTGQSFTLLCTLLWISRCLMQVAFRTFTNVVQEDCEFHIFVISAVRYAEWFTPSLDSPNYFFQNDGQRRFYAISHVSALLENILAPEVTICSREQHFPALSKHIPPNTPDSRLFYPFAGTVTPARDAMEMRRCAIYIENG